MVERWQDTPSEMMTKAVKPHIAEHVIPKPSYILFTGRELLAVWRLASGVWCLVSGCTIIRWA
jgi:hypothetical protein